MKKFLSLILIFSFISTASYAVNFDTSVDESIRKDYNVEFDELPALPSVVPSATDVEEVSSQSQIKYNPTGKTYILKSGTKINLVTLNSVTCWSQKGSVVTLKATNGFVAKDGTIIPSGTIFKGKITDSHPPQMTGNGGLIELEINEIYFNGVKSFLDSKVAIANDKKIFLGNIKGKRSYWSNYSKAMTVGKKVFNGTLSCTNAMYHIPVVNLVSWVPVTLGSAVYVGNAIVAPFISAFQKGGSIGLPAGSEIQIKLTENSEIYG